MTYWIIFLSAFGAATLLPFYSEVAVVVGIEQGASPWLVWAVASLGNTLGAVVNWGLARYLLQFQDRAWFPVKKQQLAKGQVWFNRYGVWSLLFAWLPIGGDALTFVAGIMRVNFWVFIALVGLGKSMRYAVIILAQLSFF